MNLDDLLARILLAIFIAGLMVVGTFILVGAVLA